MIRQPDPIARLRYYQNCSSVSRDDLFLKILAEERKLDKEITALIKQHVETLALAWIMQWQREGGLILLEGSREKRPSHSALPLPPMRLPDEPQRRLERRRAPGKAG